MRGLPALRIPAGWNISWNNINVNWKREQGGLGGSSLYYAVNQGTRFIIDVMFRPEFDPNGVFLLQVIYVPWPRTEKGRRRKDVPFAEAENSEVVHEFETRSMDEMVEQLQHWIARCSIWMREGN